MENLITAIEKFPMEIAKSLETLSQTTDPAMRKIHSEIVHNLSVSMGIFFDVMHEGHDCGDDCDMDDEFFMNEENETRMEKPPKPKNQIHIKGKKKGR